MSAATSPRLRPEFIAEMRTSRWRSLRRIVDGPLAGTAVATSPRGTRILSPRASSLSVGTRRARRSSAYRLWSARRRTRTSWVSPAASSIVVATSPVIAARRVIATGATLRPRSPARSRSNSTRSSGLLFSSEVSTSTRPGILPIACTSSREIRSSSSTSGPRTLYCSGFWPKGPASVKP